MKHLLSILVLAALGSPSAFGDCMVSVNCGAASASCSAQASGGDPYVGNPSCFDKNGESLCHSDGICTPQGTQKATCYVQLARNSDNSLVATTDQTTICCKNGSAITTVNAAACP